MDPNQGDKKQDLLKTGREEPSYLVKGSVNAKRTSSSNLVILVLFILVFSIIGMLALFMFYEKPKTRSKPMVRTDMEQDLEASSSARLPSFGGNDEDDGGDGGAKGISDMESEKLAFGSYYKPNKEEYDYKLDNYELPLNVKVDVSNYYDISRKVEMDAYIDELNANGFAIIDNPFTDSRNDFFATYSELSAKGVPNLVTSDFMMYYYQETLKHIYKDIEANIFYDEMWQISKAMFEMADSSYREYQKEVGVANDPVLEAQRRVVAYFAVMLKLLEPRSNQVDASADYSDTKFTQDEVSLYTKILPFYLTDDTTKELDLIRAAKETAKSPVLLYRRNYEPFNIANNYKNNAKLANFYLASRWMNSLFPLYFQNEDCPNCFLDKEDWQINMLAANYIAKLFDENQELQNRWAKIYKVISYFSGLRSDLTYLHYVKAAKELFGDDFDIKTVFSKDNPDFEANIIAFQEKLSSMEFLDIEGSYDRDNPDLKPYIGMRMLQENYWPNNYIFPLLNAPFVTDYERDGSTMVDQKVNVTYCQEQLRKFSRCAVFGLDIINLIYDIPDEYDYFIENTSYKGYNTQSQGLKDELSHFNKFSWHANTFWNDLNSVKRYMEDEGDDYPPYTQNYDWKIRKINASLSSWINSQLPADTFSTHYQQSSGLGAVYANEFNYIEPDMVLVDELIANVKMLTDTLLNLQVIKDTGFTYKKFVKLSDELDSLRGIMLKEVAAESLSQNDIRYIDWFIKQFSIEKPIEKYILLKYGTRRRLTDNIKNTKLLVLVYTKDDKKIFTVGPVYDYREE